MKHHIRPGPLRLLALSLSLFLAGSTHAQSGPGSALFVAGTVNYVAVPHTAAFNSLPITVMAWVNASQPTGQQGLINKYVANSPAPASRASLPRPRNTSTIRCRPLRRAHAFIVCA